MNSISRGLAEGEIIPATRFRANLYKYLDGVRAGKMVTIIGRNGQHVTAIRRSTLAKLLRSAAALKQVDSQITAGPFE